MTLAKISIHELREPRHVARATIDEDGIEELAQDIRRVGVLVPLHVKEVDDGYEVVAGHRRLLAARRAGLVALPCLVRSSRDPDPTVIKLHENLYRQELTPVEEAAFFAELLPTCENDTDKLSAMLKQTRSYVEGRLLLLSGDPDVLHAVAQREISLGVAEELNKIQRESDRKWYLKWARETGATRATVRQWRFNSEAQVEPAPGAPVVAGTPAPVAVQGRDVFECLLCKDKEPVTDLEFWHVHRSCRVRLERALERQDPGSRIQDSGGPNADAK